MIKLEIPVKFQHGDTIYTTKKTKMEIACSICEGKKTITYNNKEMRCPECMGKGKFTSSKDINTVCDEPYIISATKIEVNSNGGINVKYRGKCGFSSRLNRSEDNLFLTKEEAQFRCDELNKVRVRINVNDIIIQECFKESHPSTDKIQIKFLFYKINKKFDKEIVVDKNNVLQDGYINYLLCKLLNIEVIKAVVKNNAYRSSILTCLWWLCTPVG